VPKLSTAAILHTKRKVHDVSTCFLHVLAKRQQKGQVPVWYTDFLSVLSKIHEKEYSAFDSCLLAVLLLE
jgi:hypothetical protein